MHACKLSTLAAVAAGLLAPAHGAAQDGESCAILCVPELKIEPTVTFENLGSRARVETGGVVETTQRETVFELIFENHSLIRRTPDFEGFIICRSMVTLV